MNLELYDQSLYDKYKNTKSSGYLDDEYELTPEFRTVEQYHFRIEDDKDIIELKELYKKSVPMKNGFQLPSSASNSFNEKMNCLLNSLDSANQTTDFGNKIDVKAETHGFYKLGPDAYDENKALQAAYQHLQLHSLNEKMESLTLDKQKVLKKMK